MKVWPFTHIKNRLVNWLVKDAPVPGIPACDIDRIIYEIRPCDIILVEGRNRISEIIKLTTRSTWSHAAIYIGPLSNIHNKTLRAQIERFFDGSDHEPLLIEGLIGKGVVVTPLSEYKKDHIRLCRPLGMSKNDMQRVMAYCTNHLGSPYDIRHVFDLLRLLFPFFFLPRQWFTSLYQRKARHNNKKQICSSLLAEAFASVKFPILPAIRRNKAGKIEFIHRNPKLFVPKDFDLSPYFEIIKYPLFGAENAGIYRSLPWREGALSNDEAGVSLRQSAPKIQKR